MQELYLFISIIVGMLNIINLSFSINKYIDEKKKNAQSGNSKRK